MLITAPEIDAPVSPSKKEEIEMPVRRSTIPMKYASFSTSGLTAEVLADKQNEFTFTLMD